MVVLLRSVRRLGILTVAWDPSGELRRLLGPKLVRPESKYCKFDSPAIVTLEIGARNESAMRRTNVDDWVEVRSKEEILATLDSKGQLDGMPFMPEMLRIAAEN